MTLDWFDRLRGHLPEASIERLAAAPGDSGSIIATPAETVHLASCDRCRRLLAGYRRLGAALSGDWIDRRGARVDPAAAERAASRRAAAGPPTRAPRLERVSAGRREAGAGRATNALPAFLVIAAVAAVAVGGFLVTRGSTPAATPSATPASYLVSRFYGVFNGWAPDSRHFLLGTSDGFAVVDTAGRFLARGNATVDWLDAAHLIDRDGHVFPISSNWSDNETNKDVKANGHGVAAIVTDWSGCLGDPPENGDRVSWYENGSMATTGDPVRAFGWSLDGRLALLGLSDCTRRPPTAPGSEWKGTVEVVEFPGHKVLGRVDGIRGPLTLNPGGTWLAAASDETVKLLEIGTGKVATLAGARLLGWLDGSHVFYTKRGSNDVLLRDVASGADVPTGLGEGEWAIPSSTGSLLVLDVATGAARRVLAADGRLLVDLGSFHLEARAPADVPSYADYGTWLQGTPWSPDGALLMLEAPKAPDYMMIAVDPSAAGAATPAAGATGSPGRT